MSGIRRSDAWSGLAALPPGLRFLLATSFFMPLASFMVLPFLAILLHERLGMAMGFVGLLLGLTTILQFSGALGGSLVAERLGLKRTMLLGLIVRTCGFGLFAAGLSMPKLAVAAVLLAAFGDALYSPANKAYLVGEVPERHRPVLLSVNNSALNTGMALGTLISGVLIARFPFVVFTLVTLMFGVTTVLHLLILPRDARRAAVGRGGGSRGDWARALMAAPAVVTLLTAYVYWYFQNYLGVFVTDAYPAFLFSLALVLNSVLIVVGQPLAATWIGRTRYTTAAAVGFPSLTLGFLAFIQGSVAFILLGTVLVSVGEGVMFLKNELEALRALPHRPTLAIGSQRLALGVGSFASGLVGGQLYSASQSAGQTENFWLYAAGQGLVATCLAALLAARGLKGPLAVAADGEASGHPQPSTHTAPRPNARPRA
ncbi:MFS transporter [Streptomyces sp. PU-14G]|uniref:MFS transporter n=1 Tax=Streptomyces sp. PU-14G TaxID=2800808 RepID=UPI0034DF8327